MTVNAKDFVYQGALQRGGKQKLKGDHAAGGENQNSEETIAEA